MRLYFCNRNATADRRSSSPARGQFRGKFRMSPATGMRGVPVLLCPLPEAGRSRVCAISPPRRGAEGRLNPNMRCHSRASRRLLPATVIQAVTSFRGWTSRVIRGLSSRLALRSSHSASRRNHHPSERPK
jgi:hypothetical protein